MAFNSNFQGRPRSNQFAPPGVNRGPVGRPRQPNFGASPTAFGSGVATNNQPGQVQPVNYGQGSNPFIQYTQSGRPTGGGTPNVRLATTGLSELARAQQSRALSLAQSADPDALRRDFFNRGQNVAIRSGQAGLQAQLRDIAGQSAMSGFGPSGFAQASRQRALQGAGAARGQALDRLGSQAAQFGEQAALGRLAAGNPIEELDLGRRMANTGITNQQRQFNARAAGSRSSARASGYERSYLITDPSTGQQSYMPESYLNFLTQYG